MERIKYSPEMKQLIKELLYHQNSQWLIMQLIVMLSYFLYALGQQGRMENLSYWLPAIGQFFIFSQIFLLKHWTKRFNEDLFLTEKIESVYLIKYADKRGIDAEWTRKEVISELNDFLRRNDESKNI
jgi:hypothetical protein